MKLGQCLLSRGILYGDDVVGSEGVVGDQVVIVLGLFVEFLYSVMRVYVSRCLYAHDVCIFSEYLVTNWVFVLSFLVTRPVHSYQLSWLQSPASHWASLEFSKEGHDIDEVVDVSVGCADGCLKWRKGECAAIEGQFCEGYTLNILLASPIFLQFGVCDVHFVLWVPVFPHLL